MERPSADGVRVMGQLNPGCAIRHPVIDGQLVLVAAPFRLAVPEGELGILGPGAERQRRRDQAGLRPGPVLLIEKRVVPAVSGRGLVKASGVLHPVGGAADELLGPDVGVVAGGAAGPGSVEVLEIRDRHRGRGRGGLGRSVRHGKR